MADVIGAELHFETVGGLRFVAGHYARIVDQEVDLVEAVVRFACGLADAVERGEIADQRIDPRAGFFGQRIGSRGQLGRIAARDDHMRAFRCHGPRRFVAQPRIAAGDQDGPALEVLVRQDFICSARKSEFAHWSSPSLSSAGLSVRYRSNQARMLSALATSREGRAAMPCELSGTRTSTVSIPRSFSAW